ncbi:MAG: glycosyltransferase [Oscillospiraceae bacterium]|nr:glycosyltransferase [Oscillospiraceae bacterium]
MESRIRVLQLVWRFNTGGAERMVVNFHNHFKNSDKVEIRTLSFTPSKQDLYEEELKEDETVFFINRFWGDRFPGILSKILRRIFYKNFRKKWLIKQISDFSPDIIHIHLANLAAEMYGVCKKLPANIKVIYHLHSMPEAIDPKRRKVIKKAVQEKVYHPLCVTELQRSSAVKYYGILPETPIIYNGIDQAPFLLTDMTQEQTSALKKELGIKEDAFVIGCVGRVTAIKNHSLLAKAAEILAEKRPVALLIIGACDQNLASKITANIKNAKVVFTGVRNDTNRLYRIMDVFALASFHESSSIVTVEAQLSGIPCVIASSISDEVIVSNGVEKISPYADPNQWARAIELAEGKRVILKDCDRFSFISSMDTLYDIYTKVKGLDI